MDYIIPNDITKLRFRWKKLTFTLKNGIDSISKRCSHTSTLVHQHLYIIGGGYFDIDTNHFQHYGDIWKYDLQNLSYECVLNDGFIPRRGHTACLFNDRIYIFGGITASSELTSQLIVYDTKDNSIVEYNRQPGIWPSARRGHTAYIYRNCMFVHGGECEDNDFIRIYCWNIDNFSWTWTFQSGTIPIGGLLLPCYDCINQMMIVYGGSSPQAISSKVLTLNVVTGEWRDNISYLRRSWFSEQKTLEKRFAGCGVTLLNDKVFLIFGGSGQEGYYNDVNMIRTEPLVSIHHDEIFKNGKPICVTDIKPDSRNGHTLTRVTPHSCIMAFGGIYPTFYFNDMWLLDFLVLPDIPPTTVLSDATPTQIMSYFSTLFDDNRFVDIKLVFDCGEHHMCHRIVLCSRSDYFRKLLDGWSSESINSISEVRLKESKYETFKWIKWFLYKGQLPDEATDSAESIWETIEMSNMFNITDIKNLCEKILCDTLKIDDDDNNHNDIINNDNMSDLLYMLRLAEMYNCNYLINKLLAYLKIRFILSKKNHDDNEIDYCSYDLSDEIINNIRKIYNDDINLDVNI